MKKELVGCAFVVVKNLVMYKHLVRDGYIIFFKHARLQVLPHLTQRAPDPSTGSGQAVWDCRLAACEAWLRFFPRSQAESTLVRQQIMEVIGLLIIEPKPKIVTCEGVVVWQNALIAIQMCP